MAWRDRFKKADISVDRLGYWWAVFGPSGVLSVLMSWIATGFTPIARYGWGAIVFAGVGAACIIMIAASALMVSWRYFNPIPKQPATSREKGQEAPPPDTILNRFVEAERGIAQNKANLRELRTEVAMLTASLRARDAEFIVKEADQVIMRTANKLLEGAYPDDAAWAADYAVWELAINRIDGIMSRWAQQPHKPFLNFEDLKLGAPPPPTQSNIKSDINLTRYKIVWLARQSYTDRRDGIFIFFASKAGELPE
jgi:hypothetical protein